MSDKATLQLQQLGFGQYEAKAYVTLLQRSPLTGYELAKASGIPRPNIYTTLQKLEERGAVVRLDDEVGVRYAPVASDELVKNLQSHFQDSLDAANQALSELSTFVEHEQIWNARGYLASLDHARRLIETAQKQIMIAVWPQEAAELAGSLDRAKAQGVEIMTLCLAGCPQECGNCRGEVFRHHTCPEQQSRWILLVPDEAEVLASEVDPGGETLSVRTRQRLLVNLASWYIRQSIAISALLQGFGDRLEGLLDPQTRATLESLERNSPNASWLEDLHRYLHASNSS